MGQKFKRACEDELYSFAVGFARTRAQYSAEPAARCNGWRVRLTDVGVGAPRDQPYHVATPMRGICAHIPDRRDKLPCSFLAGVAQSG